MKFVQNTQSTWLILQIAMIWAVCFLLAQTVVSHLGLYTEIQKAFSRYHGMIVSLSPTSSSPSIWKGGGMGYQW